MSWHVLPTKRSPKVDEEISTDVFMQTRRLLTLWREDPDRLAVACACYALQGFSDQSLIWDVAQGDPELRAKSMSDDEALILITVCLRRRNPRLLRARAEGLLMGLEVLAQDAADAQRHDARVQSGIIECRQVEFAERLIRLRDSEARSEGMAGSGRLDPERGPLGGVLVPESEQRDGFGGIA